MLSVLIKVFFNLSDKILYSKYIRSIRRLKKFNIEKNFIIPKRQALHAKSIGFIHPYKKKEMFFESEEPKEFKGLISLMNKK